MRLVAGRAMSGADDAAFTAYVAEHATRLLRLAYLLTGDRNAAEDLLQGALERTYRRWVRLQHGESVHAYVRRAIVNGAIDRHRRRLPEQYGGVEVERSSPDETELVATRDELLRAVARLPRGQRAVLVLRYFEDLSEDDTAAALGCSVGTVKSQHARALAALRTAMTSRSR